MLQRRIDHQKRNLLPAEVGGGGRKTLPGKKYNSGAGRNQHQKRQMPARQDRFEATAGIVFLDINRRL